MRPIMFLFAVLLMLFSCQNPSRIQASNEDIEVMGERRQ